MAKRRRKRQRSARTVKVRGHRRGPRGKNRNKRRKATVAHGNRPQRVRRYTRAKPKT